VLLRYTSEYRGPHTKGHNSPKFLPSEHGEEWKYIDEEYGNLDVSSVDHLVRQMSDPAGRVLHWVAYEPDRLVLWAASAIGSFGAKYFPALPFDLKALWNEVVPEAPDAFSAPDIEITNPVSGQAVNGVVKVQGTAKGADRVEVMVDDGQYQTAQGTSSWSFDLDTTGWQGMHRVRVLAVDSKGNGTVKVLILVSPNSAPELVAPMQRLFTIHPGDHLQLKLKWWDYDSDPVTDGCMLKDTEDDCNTIPGLTYTPDPSHKGRSTLTWTPSEDQKGTYLFTFFAVDDHGNRGEDWITVNVE
jgi:hypothetical protein